MSVPLIVSFEGHTQEGTTVDFPVDIMDIVPTFLQLAEIEPSLPLDGTSFWDSIVSWLWSVFFFFFFPLLPALTRGFFFFFHLVVVVVVVVVITAAAACLYNSPISFPSYSTLTHQKQSRMLPLKRQNQDHCFTTAVILRSVCLEDNTR